MRVGGAQNPLNGSDYGRTNWNIGWLVGGRFSVVVLNRPNIKHLFLARFSDIMQLNLHMSEKSCNFAGKIRVQDTLDMHKHTIDNYDRNEPHRV